MEYYGYHIEVINGCHIDPRHVEIDKSEDTINLIIINRRPLKISAVISTKNEENILGVIDLMPCIKTMINITVPTNGKIKIQVELTPYKRLLYNDNGVWNISYINSIRKVSKQSYCSMIIPQITDGGIHTPIKLSLLITRKQYNTKVGSPSD